MSKIQSMVPAELVQETDELQPFDELLTTNELETISLFESVKKTPSFDKFPGTTILRRGTPGRVMCSQGQAGATAYYILTSDDVLELRQRQVASINEMLEARQTADAEAAGHQFLRVLSDSELESRKQKLLAEIEAIEQRLKAREQQAAANGDEPGSQPSSEQPYPQVAGAHLLVDLDAGRQRKGLLHRLFHRLRRGGNSSGDDHTSNIPIDGPTDIDPRSLRAPLHESDIFGEMSCMSRAPRSATVIIEQDCYLLEMLRNVLDMLQRDLGFRKRMDDQYRRRVMESHVRRLSVFSELTDDEYAQLRDSIELDVFDAGTIIFEEHDPADSLYVVRSGLVKVVKNATCHIRADEMQPAHWEALRRELAECTESDDKESPQVRMGREIYEKLSPELQAAVQDAKPDASWSDDQRAILLAELGKFVDQSADQVKKQFGKTKQELIGSIDDSELHSSIDSFPDKTENWSQLETRIFYRSYLEAVFPEGLPKRLATHGPMRTLAYIGRGEILGEMGVLLDQPRSATCVAYDHPEGYHQKIPDSRTGLVPSRVEVLRIPRDAFEQVLNSSERLRERVEEVVRSRGERSAKRRHDHESHRSRANTQSVEFESLGLVQGQQLMLINLDRCTRCNACVEACVNTHDDGRNRLYLDGPRFENYLVPLTCRSCLDPVCMIGCPVGAINRGDNGEIRIRDWCIGCKLCAEQCPYGAIQMNDLESVDLSDQQQQVLNPAAAVKAVTSRAVVCDLCSSQPSQDPACVYSCPHDAAIRVDAREFFFS